MRFDLTQDQRYALSDVTKTILEKVKSRMFIHVYLEGEFPSEFKRLQIETRQYLEELKSPKLPTQIRFIHPDGKRDQLIQSGMYPSQLTVQENGKLSNAIIFPWVNLSTEKNVSLYLYYQMVLFNLRNNS